jgi:hypothetical protein
MTTELLELSRRLTCLPEVSPPVLDAEARSVQRARVVAHLSAVLDEQQAGFARNPSRRIGFRVGAVLGGVLAVAAGVALFLGYGRGTSTTQASVTLLELRGAVVCAAHTGNTWEVCNAKAVETDRWRTLSGAHAVLRTPSGIQVEMDADTQLTMSAIAPSVTASRVGIESGRATFQVPHQAAGHSFSVTAPDLTVLVHGTVFSVAIRSLPDGAIRSCVEVTEGVVSVKDAHGETLLPAPRAYGCEAATEELNDSQVLRIPEEASSVPRLPTSPSKAAPAGSSLERSTLVIEARMLQMALGAERQGDLVLAEKRLSLLLTQYPNSVVIPEAKAALTRVQDRQRSLGR